MRSEIYSVITKSIDEINYDLDKIGINSIFLNTQKSLMYMVCMVSDMSVALICIDHRDEANRWKDPIRVSDPRNLNSDDLQMMFGFSKHCPKESWRYVYGATNIPTEEL